jgi:hypothetical protein
MRRIPSFHEFMVERLGDPRRPLLLLHNLFVRLERWFRDIDALRRTA